MRSQFVPAKNSRHRTAALSLYRALIKASKQIELPRRLQNDSASHPVAQVVRKRFENNKRYTSLRLIYSTMATGYKFLTLLTKAQTVRSSEQKQVISFLKERALVAKHKQPIIPEETPLEEPSMPKVPLLRNIAAPGEPPEYVVNPRPEGETKSKRMPHLAVDSFGQPFVRFIKPQPEGVSQMIGRRRFLWKKRIDGVADVETVLLPAAKLEDEWDELVEEQLRKEKNITPSPQETSPRASYQWNALVSKLWWEYSLEKMWTDWVARGKALHNLVEAERDERNPMAADANTTNDSKPTQSARNVQLLPRSPTPVLEAAYKVRSELGPEELKGEGPHDPFSSLFWVKVVEHQHSRIARWMSQS